MITRGLVLRLGLSQLICWGVSYYLIGVFGEAIVAETGWSPALVYGGFSASLIASGLASPMTGREIDRRGGRTVMAAGSVLLAASCLGLALSRDLVTYYGAWIVMGVAMRLCLYDAAFATLARLGGHAARRPISQITLLGGLASSVLWPVGGALAWWLGWRGAVGCYAAFALMTLPLHLAIPGGRFDAPGREIPDGPRPLAASPADRRMAAILFMLVMTLSTVLNSALSAHMIAILIGLGMASGLAVWTAALRGVGQSIARGVEIMYGRRLDPLMLGIIATAIVPVGFALAFMGGADAWAGIGFAFLYGMGNGLITIVRGTQPLVLFDVRSYGALVGRLIAPSFYLSALAPLGLALVIERYGERPALALCGTVAAVVLGCALALWWRFWGRERG